MALGDAYATVNEMKGYADHMTDSVDDTQLTEVLLQASRALEKYCGRQFNDAGSATAREFEPTREHWLEVDDFSTVTGLVVKVDTAGDGTFATTLASTNYKAHPLNGTNDGETGWPFWKLRTVNYCWPLFYELPPVQVTARWGWTAVPTNIKIACIYLALETFKLKGAPFGVAGFGDLGPIRVRDNPKVMGMLNPYRRDAVLVA